MPFRKSISLAVVALLFATASATPRSLSIHPKSWKPKVQQHSSFIPEYKPSAVMVSLQTALSGKVTQQHILPAALPMPAQTPSQKPLGVISINTPVQKQQKHWHFGKRPALQNEVDPHLSWVMPLTENQARQLSQIIATMLDKELSKKLIPLQILDLPFSQQNSSFAINLNYGLKGLGYSLCTAAACGSANHVQYRITSLGRQYLLRLKINNTEMVRLYEKDMSGSLVAASMETRFQEEH